MLQSFQLQIMFRIKSDLHRQSTIFHGSNNKNMASTDGNVLRGSFMRQSQDERIWEEDYMKEAREKIRSKL